MAEQNWNDLGEQISHIVSDAIREQNYSSLNETINRVIGDAIDSGSDALHSVLDSALGSSDSADQARRRQASQRQNHRPQQTASNPEHNARAYETHSDHGYQSPPFGARQNLPKTGKTKSLYASMNSPTIKGGSTAIIGGVLVLNALTRLLTMGLFGNLLGVVGSFPFAFALILGFIGGYLVHRGVSTVKKVGRFRKYQSVLGDKTYAEVKKLSTASGKTEAFVFQDLTEMIRDGWFLQGHVDDEKTTLMVSDETWQQYLDSHEEILKKRQEDIARRQEAQQQEKEQAEAKKVSAEVQEVLNKGNAYLKRLRQCNDAIPGEEISAKISRMEMLVQRIFDRVKTHPEVIPDLKKMMNYYLPTTVKLLKAYEDMDSQPVQGENITKAKTEIEQTIDTLNTAFEKLLDSIFQDTAWDVSSDISVLNTMLAQEGLSGGSDFSGAAAQAAAPEEKAIRLEL